MNTTELLQDYTYYKSMKDTAYEQGKVNKVVYATTMISEIRTRLQNLGYDISELVF